MGVNSAKSVKKNINMVKIKLHKGKSSAEQQDVIAGVNGKLYQIKRGVPVEVPVYIAEIIENSQNEISESLEYIKELSSSTEI